MARIVFSLSLLAILIGVSLCGPLDSSDDNEQGVNPLQQAMAVFNMVSKFNEFKGRAVKSFPDPIKALSELTLFGTFKMSFILVSGLTLLSALFPSLVAGFGISAPFLVRSDTNQVTENVSDVKNSNYEMVAHSIRALTEISFEALDAKDEDCRSRAICEIGEYGARFFPAGAEFMKAFGSKLNFGGKYLAAIIKGMGKVDCALAYRSCAHSPFKKLSNLSTYNIF